MAATTEQGYIGKDAPTRQVTMTARGGTRALIRTAQRFLGVTLSVAALSLLLLPFGAETTAEILLKLMFALVLGFVGAALWQAGGRVAAPELEIDVVRREVRLIRGFGPSRSIVTRRRFRDLGAVKTQDHSVSFWDADQELLAEVTIADDTALRSLRSALRDEGLAL
ncbi:hypothetical protein E4Z66_01605 [Aliishimia ponticola]|uniref:Uncharacterized protein n=1 Tax=Aliishimia ponticola TaxID=2499833 RepID=A0A4V3XKU3_9RHOB|nr:hypothetical protein [Aliishimia ponticola]THH38293.1 hypothetical protein E4Z66_01605 [Aliishimia ponticola]